MQMNRLVDRCDPVSGLIFIRFKGIKITKTLSIRPISLPLLLDL